MANIRLKEQPQETSETEPLFTSARFHPRHAQPKPPTAMERLIPALKRLALFLVFAAVAAAIFLAIPFRQWDQYADWKAIRDTLASLSAQPDSLDGMKNLHSIALAVGILWDEPTGTRPEKWHQRLERQHYDAAYGVVQTLALGIIQQGNAARGLDELESLRQRTGSASVPNIPSADQLKAAAAAAAQAKTACAACKDGRVEKPCTPCNGQGWTTISAANTSFPLKATLRNTRARRSITPVQAQRNAPDRQPCFSCRGTGKQAAPCPSCGGKSGGGQGGAALLDAAQLSAVPGLLARSIAGTLLNIDAGMAVWRPIHTLANIRGALLGDSGADFQDGQPDEADTAGNDRPATAMPSSGPLTHIRTACETLLETPLSKPDAQTLGDAARAEVNPPDLRNLALSAYGLSLILRGEMDAYRKICDFQKRTFGAPYPAPFFTESDCIAACPECAGKGEKPNPCPQCMNPAAPKNTAACAWCKGKGSMLGTCIDCNGEKTAFRPSDSIKAAYRQVLADLIAYCTTATGDAR